MDNPIVAVDCREGLQGLGDGSVNLVLTDPPYFLDGMGDDWDRKKLNGKVRPGVVGSLPCGMKFDIEQGRNLQRFLSPIAEELMRVVKPGAFVLCFSQARLVHRAAVAFEDAGFEIRDMMAWTYEGQAKAQAVDYHIRRNRALSEADKAAWISAVGGRKTPQVKPQMEPIIVAQAPREGTFAENWVNHRCGLVDFSRPLIVPDKFPGQLVPHKKARVHKKYGHLTPKPVPVLRHLIRMFCDDNSDAVVLDPFSGCGSTGVAAHIEGRAFVGFEIDAVMARRGNGRIAEAMREGGEPCLL